jgi:hypothetical protein
MRALWHRTTVRALQGYGRDDPRSAPVSVDLRLDGLSHPGNHEGDSPTSLSKDTRLLAANVGSCTRVVTSGESTGRRSSTRGSPAAPRSRARVAAWRSWARASGTPGCPAATRREAARGSQRRQATSLLSPPARRPRHLCLATDPCRAPSHPLTTCLQEPILYRDYPIVQTNVMLVGGTLVMLNLLVDLTYAWLDPQIHYQ